jgi:hypothetical protein
MLPEQLFLTLPPLLAEQEDLQPPVATVFGSIEYRTWRQRLERIDEILRNSRAEEAFIRLALKRRLEELNRRAAEKGRPETGMCAGDQVLFQRMASVALRTTVARVLVGGSFRAFSARLADSSLLQWFCRLSRLGEVRIPGKSQLQLYQDMVEESQLREVIHTLLEAGVRQDEPLELNEKLDLETEFLDSTCVKLNIHYPTDWVLLRDATRTLMKATLLIRRRGLKVRMREPKQFLKGMNRLSMEMTRQARRAGSRKGRKQTLRKMKRQVKLVAAHARRHRDLLEKRWAETELSREEAQQILDRIDTILERLPWVVKQAHERIIGGRQVANEEKILSLYEGHAAVYVRGKAGAEVEFGSQLLLAEAECGLITDWELVCGNPEHDTVLLKRSLEREGPWQVRRVVGDRGFDSKATREWLAARKVVNAIAPRDAGLLQMRLKDTSFQQLQMRRGQTEARIAIFKNAFLGSPLLAKGHQNQARLVAWNVLTHDLWLLAGLEKKAKVEFRKTG